jgi:RimJ/RimL family protein N-acetyltransferase
MTPPAGPRLLLRDFRATDVAAVHAFAADPVVTRLTDFGPNTSARVPEKIGMRCEGRLRDHLLVRGAWRDSLLYAAVGDDPG